ncbi:unnamed protein product [Brassicogethes aeneus]|uniref:Major facilitator superfamily (MFS) profile domain-containing protein n=1 Tax=Brassicogethes aeneus TaxID=1431903 RepID=A0A9P0FCF5_BRAAE|nr:unnamed protein product [Brassicogethes aeneus]
MTVRMCGTKFIYLLVPIVNIVSISVGTSISWPSSQLPKLEDADESPLGRAITDNEASWITSLYTIGGIVGPLMFGYLNDLIGPKKTLIVLSVPFIGPYLVFAFANNIILYYVGRFVLGIGISSVYSICTLYVANIAENKNRGLLSSATMFFVALGSLFSYCIGPYTSSMVFNLILAVIPSVYLVLLIILAPESPRYLIKRGDIEGATKSLEIIHGYTDDRIKKEIEDIQNSAMEKKIEGGRITDLFSTKAARFAFFMGIFLTTTQQLSGFGVVLTYTSQIFDATKSKLTSSQSSIIVGVMQVLCAPIAPLFSDKFGRRIMMLFSLTGGIFSEILLATYFTLNDQGKNLDSVSWLPLFSMSLLMAAKYSGLANLPWAIIAEIYPSKLKSIGSSIINAFSNLVGFAALYFFNGLVDSIGLGGMFYLYSCLMAVATVILYTTLPETKGKSFEEIQDIISGHKKNSNNTGMENPAFSEKE